MIRVEISARRIYTIAEIAKMVNRSRKTILEDIKNGLLCGEWGDVRTRCVNRHGRQYFHRTGGWLISGKEAARYMEYRFALNGRMSPGYSRGKRPRAIDLLRQGYSVEEVAKELGILVASVRRMKYRAAKNGGVNDKEKMVSETLFSIRRKVNTINSIV